MWLKCFNVDHFKSKTEFIICINVIKFCQTLKMYLKIFIIIIIIMVKVHLIKKMLSKVNCKIKAIIINTLKQLLFFLQNKIIIFK